MNRRTILIILFLQIITLVHADETIPCIVMSGNADSEIAAELSKYKRIYFGSEGMKLSNPDDEADDIELLYSEYNRLRIGRSNPNVAIQEVSSQESISIVYNKRECTLEISPTDEEITIGIFTIDGTLIIKTNEKIISLSSLEHGTYIALAIGERSTHSLKFIR